MRARFSALFLICFALSETGAAQVPPLGQAYCVGDGNQGDCPCPSQVVFREDFDEGVLPVGWAVEGLWTIADACGGPCGSSPYAYFGDENSCSYGPIQQISNRLISPAILLPSAPRIDMTFCTIYVFEPESDKGFVRVHGEDGTVLQYVFKPAFVPQPLDLTALAGQVVHIEFYAQATLWGATQMGWKVDNLVVRSTHNGNIGQGCLNSTMNGGWLGATGSASLAAKNLVLYTQKLPPSVPVLFLATDSPYQAPLPLWAGLSCMGGNPLSLQSMITQTNGAAATKPFQAHAAHFQPGTTYGFQAWYRDVGALAPCGIERNLTNAYRIFVQP